MFLQKENIKYLVYVYKGMKFYHRNEQLYKYMYVALGYVVFKTQKHFLNFFVKFDQRSLLFIDIFFVH